MALLNFNNDGFVLHSGRLSRFKVDCDALTREDWEAVAELISHRFLFREVIGIPRGGIPFAEALQPYITKFGHVLIVDDVYTTGRSMHEARATYLNRHPGEEVLGVVLFARGRCPEWIEPVFSMEWPV